MTRRASSFLLFAVAALGCGDDLGPVGPSEPPPPGVADVRLAEIAIPSLPSPFYRFEYDDAGKIALISYASDLVTYEVLYDGDRISEMRTIGLIQERLSYFYDEAGNVSLVTYRDRTDTVYVRISLAYDGDHLVLLERERLFEGTFQLEKRTTFLYRTDGNLAELSEQYFPVAGRPAQTFIDRFEAYDAGINVDGFSLLHTEFFDHVVFLPGVQLQRTNATAVTRSGDGAHFHVDYTYTYDDENRPLLQSGDFVWLTGADAGRRFQVGSAYSYED
jgi:hypothetical protein